MLGLPVLEGGDNRAMVAEGNAALTSEADADHAWE
jgi:hypothetical protein